MPIKDLPKELETPKPSKRYKAARYILSGLLSNPSTNSSPETLVRIAYEYADELIRQNKD